MRNYFLAVVLCLAVAVSAFGGELSQNEVIRVVTPQNASEVIGKKPEIRIEFTVPVDPSSIVLLLDGTDLTQLGTKDEKSFTCTSFGILPSGPHSLTVIAKDPDGNSYQVNSSFTSRHTAAFEEAYSNNEAAAIYESALAKPERAVSTPYSKFEGNINTDSKLKNREYEAGFTANLRYFDQSLPVLSTVLSSGIDTSVQDLSLLEKGFSLANFLFTGRYIKDPFMMTAEIGDVLVSETQNTVSGLARRGGKLMFEYEDATLNTFLVKGERVFGFNGGLGINGSGDDHIFGASAGLKLPDRKMELKTVYVRGGEPPSSVGTATSANIPESTPGLVKDGAHTKGDVIGLQLVTDFFENRFRTEMEFDSSRFDFDLDDDEGKESDVSYRAKGGGALGRYIYEAGYEFYGRDYAVIGNQGAMKDAEIFSFMNGLTLEGHSMTLALSRTNDNVRKEKALPRIVKHDGTVTYSFMKIPQLPVTFIYQKSLQDSTREPDGMNEIEIDTDTATGSVSYVDGGFSTSFTAVYSFLNDRTSTGADTRTVTYVLVPSYAAPVFSILPMASWNRTKDTLSDIKTDTYTGGLNFYSKFFDDRMAFDAGGTYTAVRNSDDTVKTNDFNSTVRVGYNMRHLVNWLVDPTISLKGQYVRHKDDVDDSNDSDEFLLFLVLSTIMPVSL
ncbi:MAG: hypothetical protein C4560_11120 [Nitrospiraceae bacterium]|nr:MAG: hypothetical protein C4560_11120 [Nitrospiraceae bacterium]